MEENKNKFENKSTTSKTKRVFAWIAIILIIAVYVTGLVFAFLGKGYAIPVVMSCILIASYIAVYFHLGQVLVKLLKRKNKSMNQGEQKDE